VKFFAYTLILLGTLLFADAAHDERRGIASTFGPGWTVVVHRAERSREPEQFRGLMIYQWGRAGLALVAGFSILNMVRRADTLDPFSPTFAGSDALDDLNRTLSEEQERRKRPFHKQ
jgi:hypothetical protein